MSHGFPLGLLTGFAFAAWTFADAPAPPLFAFACAALDMPAAVLMDDTLVCLDSARVIRSDDLMQEVLNKLRASK